MPIYEYICSACGNRADVLHGVHVQGPSECPACGAKGTLRKAIAAPAVHFKGSGWAKKERRVVSSPPKSDSDSTSDGKKESGGSGSSASGEGEKESATPAAPATSPAPSGAGGE
jgi:putative FmdB family regulatory protein